MGVGGKGVQQKSFVDLNRTRRGGHKETSIKKRVEFDPNRGAKKKVGEVGGVPAN